VREKELTAKEIFHANILDSEPDRGRIQWRKRQYYRPRNRTRFRPKTRHPDPEDYYNVLRKAGRNLCVCEQCGSDYRITIHHKDGNPYNQSIENLEVLCWNCHLAVHDPTEEGVHDEREGTRLDSDDLDDPEIRKFYGVVDEEEDL